MGKHKLYESESHALFDEACRLGLADLDYKPAFPYPTKKYPHQSKWHSLGAVLLTLPADNVGNRHFLAGKNPNYPCVYDSNKNTMTCNLSKNSQYSVTFDVDSRLGWHLRGGHAAYLRFSSCGIVEWVTLSLIN